MFQDIYFLRVIFITICNFRPEENNNFLDLEIYYLRSAQLPYLFDIKVELN